MGRRGLKPGEKPAPECRKMRHFRAASGKTQREISEEARIDESAWALMELGVQVPSAEELARGAAAAGLSEEYGDEVLLLDEIHGRRRERCRVPRSSVAAFSTFSVAV